jgi:hypothetical protein
MVLVGDRLMNVNDMMLQRGFVGKMFLTEKALVVLAMSVMSPDMR